MWKLILQSIFVCLIVSIDHASGRTARAYRNIPNYKSAIAEWPSYNIFEPDGPGTYAFGFEINDPATGNVQFRDEERLRNGTVRGAFGVLMSDGNLTIQRYTSDHNGFRVKTETRPFVNAFLHSLPQVPDYYQNNVVLPPHMLPRDVLNAIYQQQQAQQLPQLQQLQPIQPIQQLRLPQIYQPYAPAYFNPNPYVRIPDVSNSILSSQRRPLADESQLMAQLMEPSSPMQMPAKQEQQPIFAILNGPDGPIVNFLNNIRAPVQNAIENVQSNLPTLSNNPVTNLFTSVQEGLPQFVQNVQQNTASALQNVQQNTASVLQNNPITNFISDPQGGLNNILNNNGLSQIFQRPQTTITIPNPLNVQRYQMLLNNRNGTRTTTKRRKTTKPTRGSTWLNEFLDDRKRQMTDDGEPTLLVADDLPGDSATSTTITSVEDN